jgi:hypothetical protein
MALLSYDEVIMTSIEELQSVQFISIKGERFALITLEEWEALLEWLETLEDIEIARRALAELKEAGGDPEKAGWLKWEEIREELA